MRSQLAAACAAMAIAVPFVAVANANGSTTRTTRTAPVTVGRQSRTTGVGIAGASIYLWSNKFHADSLAKKVHNGGACTLAFAVRSNRTGKDGVLTAGHCVATLPGTPSYSLHQTTNVPPGGTDPGKLLAVVGRGAYRMGVHGDSAFGVLAMGAQARPYVFVGKARTSSVIPVVGYRNPQNLYGKSVCYSGAASGEHCGFIVGARHQVKFSEHGKTFQIDYEYSASAPEGKTCTSVKGDSGSPVYLRSGSKAYAVGILSGGQPKSGGCPFYFTPVGLALSQLDLSLLRAKP